MHCAAPSPCSQWLFLSPSQKVLPPRLFTVGRLDVASHGLILVTNDGHWAQKVIHPSAEITKVRWSVGGWSWGCRPRVVIYWRGQGEGVCVQGVVHTG